MQMWLIMTHIFGANFNRYPVFSINKKLNCSTDATLFPIIPFGREVCFVNSFT